MATTKIKNGKVFLSPHALYRIPVQGANPIRWNQAGQPIEYAKELCAEFGTAGDEIQVHNFLTGGTDMGADIQGGLWDSASYAEDRGWTQEQHDMVVQAVLKKCEVWPTQVQEWTAPKVTAPWPTYDGTHHKQIPALAVQLGLVGEALAYERQEKNRDEVVEKLTAELAAQSPVPVETVEELTAA